MINYFWRVLVSIDQFFNVLLYPLLNLWLKPKIPFGNPDETLSSVFGKNSAECKFCNFMCRVLNVFDPDHCNKSIEHDE